ncbi:MAG: exodeoxyribonuclease VII small subunit [Olsenella sp.]|nr:exodeoxyribonuclease VII small subunit [Olsenella sp.]
MAKPDTSAYKTFDQITGRLDQIVDQVRDKDTSLERSLDLFDEAIALGSKAVGLVDSTDFSAEERGKLREASGKSSGKGDSAQAGEGA